MLMEAEQQLIMSLIFSLSRQFVIETCFESEILAFIMGYQFVTFAAVKHSRSNAVIVASVASAEVPTAASITAFAKASAAASAGAPAVGSSTASTDQASAITEAITMAYSQQSVPVVAYSSSIVMAVSTTANYPSSASWATDTDSQDQKPQPKHYQTDQLLRWQTQVELLDCHFHHSKTKAY